MRKILFFAVMLFSVGTAQAQLRNEPYDYMDLVVGVKAGASAATLTKLGGDYKFFPYGGIYAELYFSRKVSMALEVSYSRKGADNVVVREGQIDEEMRDKYYYGVENPYNYNLDYLNTTYLFKFHPAPVFNVYTGMCLGRTISARAKVADTSIDIKEHVHSGDFSVPVGAEILIGKHITIDGRWNWSPRWISKNVKARRLLGKPCNNFFSLTVGYKFQVL